MATPAQLAEKARHDRAEAPTYRPGPNTSAFEEIATPAQLAEKARQDRPTEPIYRPGPSSIPLDSATPAQLAEKAGQGHRADPVYRPNQPPPLPPREPSFQAFSAPPAYSSDDEKRSELISNQWRSNDPRSSSTHSLVPSESGRDGRRTLLLVYIHGFMGNETSFQSFPAHVHNLLSITLAETHLVHTKIYPRYKSRKPITFARDDFGKWLEPHEKYSTDVILLGHSMGGILSAEVVLQPPYTPATGQPFMHRILGTINFDTPFLGMHPGVIVSGIGSLFRPAPDPPGLKRAQASHSEANTPSIDSQASISTPSYAPSTIGSEMSSQISHVSSAASPLATPPPNDPYFNPPFPNDVRIPERKGWGNVLHFINKHAEGVTTHAKLNGLTSATSQYFMSHLEFGGCLADYPGLIDRYNRLRRLEDVDELAGRNTPGYRPPTRRIRFINYYTASTGRPKPQKIPPGHVMTEDGTVKPIEEEMKDMSLDQGTLTPTQSTSTQHRNNKSAPPPGKEAEDSLPTEQMHDLGENSGVQDQVQESPEMRHIDSMPINDDDYEAIPALPSPEEALEPSHTLQNTPSEPPLPPIPEIPTEPQSIDLSIYTDKDARKIAEKEHKRVMKVYQQAVKDRENAIKDRRKLAEKREKKARQEEEKNLKAEEKQRLKEEKEEQKRLATINPEPKRKEIPLKAEQEKPKRDKKFCMLPDATTGKRDECWVRIYMEGVDEVGAHCGLFFPGPQYESLVGDVGARIEKWVQEDAAKRAGLSSE